MAGREVFDIFGLQHFTDIDEFYSKVREDLYSQSPDLDIEAVFSETYDLIPEGFVEDAPLKIRGQSFEALEESERMGNYIEQDTVFDETDNFLSYAIEEFVEDSFSEVL